MLTLLGNETLFDPFELPLLSTCKLALADPKCRLCLFSGSVNRGYDPPTAGPSRGELMSGCDNGIAITPASSPCERFLFRVGTLGVEFVGFHNPRVVLGRRGLDPMLLPPVPERLRKGELKSGFPPPIKALRKLQRVGLVTLTCSFPSVEAVGTGDGADGYGG
jgi:hypothetical protein